MNSFKAFCNDTITILKKDGTLIGPLKTAFCEGVFTVFDKTLDVSEGDTVERNLPNGKVERYNVVEADFTKGMGGIPDHYKLTVNKEGLNKPDHKPAVTNHFTFTNSQGIQVGNDNTINMQNFFSEIIEQIEKSSGSPEEKKEAKSRLRAFLEHPLTAAVFGGVVSGLAGQLK